MGTRGLTALTALVICFGALVEMRSAFMQRRMTDLGVYLRAGWAARTGADIYDVTDANGWHFQYPPLFAILMAPLADPPAGTDRAGTVPYPVSVAIWYGLSVRSWCWAPIRWRLLWSEDQPIRLFADNREAAADGGRCA